MDHGYCISIINLTAKVIKFVYQYGKTDKVTEISQYKHLFFASFMWLKTWQNIVYLFGIYECEVFVT